MQAAAWAPPLHPNRRGRVSYRLSLLGLRLLQFRLCQVFRLREGCLERLNQDLVLFQVRLGIRRKTLPPDPQPNEQAVPPPGVQQRNADR